jgi:hypothetical protein
MKIDFKEISRAWYNKIRHSAELKDLADKRFDICLQCPSKQEILNIKGTEWALKCGECGCPLKGKVYSPNTHIHPNGSCPLGKWKEVEDEYLKFVKTTKTII